MDYLPQRDYCENCGVVFTEKMFLLLPLIPGTKGSGARPYWWVMIRCATRDRITLKQTLRSVLAQDPGYDVMQIADDDDPY